MMKHMGMPLLYKILCYRLIKYLRWEDITENMIRAEHGLTMRGAY